MGRAVGAQRGEVAQRVALEEVEELQWDHGGHRPKVNPTRLILWRMSPAATRPPVPADKLRIGLILPTWTTTDVRWSEVLEIAATAAEVGFDALYVSDHLLLPSNNAELKRRAGVDFPDDPDIELEGYMECFTVLAALAVAIPRLALGSFVASTGYRNPGLMAKMAVTIDDISDGRLVLGLGAGDSEGEHLTFGFPHEQRVGRDAARTRPAGYLRSPGRADHGRFGRCPCLCPRDPGIAVQVRSRRGETGDAVGQSTGKVTPWASGSSLP